MNHRQSGALVGVTERWQNHAKAFREMRTSSGTPSYNDLLLKASDEVPAETQEQIDIDVPRTFGALPSVLQPENQDKARAVLGQILLAAEWATSTSAQAAGMGSTYTQGMNYLAAMCLVGVDEGEELAFWLFMNLLENVLGLRFFAEWPPLLTMHALVASAAELSLGACPELAALLGDEFTDIVSMLGFKFFIPCYVGCMPAEPLVALWDDLFSGDGMAPLLVWFLSLLRHLERGILGAIRGQMDQYPNYPKAPFALQHVLLLTGCIVSDWRPQENIDYPSGAEIAKLLQDAESRILDEAQDRQLAQRCGIPHDLVTTLHHEFLALPVGEGDGIDLGTLRRILWNVAPQHITEESAARLFELLDRDGSGSLDFYELMTGIVALCEGSSEKKLQYMFNLYDTDRSGYLEKDELLCLAQALVKLSGSLHNERISRPRSRTFASPNTMEGKLDDDIPNAFTSLSGSLSDERIGRPRSRTYAAANTREGTLDDDIPKHLKKTGSINVNLSSSAKKIRRRLLLLDKCMEGRVSWEDFRIGVLSDPLLSRCFAQVWSKFSTEARHWDLDKKVLEEHEKEYSKGLTLADEVFHERAILENLIQTKPGSEKEKPKNAKDCATAV